MTKCRTCGSFVTPGFARVFGNNDGEVYGCPGCSESVDLCDGGAARPNV
jgi:hypothetical protein